MPSKRAHILNFLLKHTLKPVLKYHLKKFAHSHDIAIIYRFRKIINFFSIFIPNKTKTTSLTINGISVTEVSAITKASSIILYLHGGGHIVGSPLNYLDLAHRLSVACSAKILLVDYNLAPENPFPAALNDVLKVYENLTKHSSSSLPLFLAGDSSGGGLVLSTLLAVKEKQLPLPVAAVCLSPWTDLALTGNSLQANQFIDPILSMPLCQLYARDSDKYHPLASPLYGDLNGLPPLLIQVSNSEILLDDSLRIHEKAQQAHLNVTLEIWDNLPHVWHLFAMFLPEGKQAIQKIADFINSHVINSTNTS